MENEEDKDQVKLQKDFNHAFVVRIEGLLGGFIARENTSDEVMIKHNCGWIGVWSRTVPIKTLLEEVLKHYQGHQADA